MRCAPWCGSSQTSIPGMRRGWSSSHVTWARRNVPTPPTFRSVLPPVSQKPSHVPHTPQPPESQWIQKDTVGEGYGGNRGILESLTRFPARRCKECGVHRDKPSLMWFSSRVLCQSQDLGSCGWVLPIPYFSVEKGSWGWGRWHWGIRVRPLWVQWEPCALWIPGPPIGIDTHLHSPQRLAHLWTLDLKAHCEVWELGARPTGCHFYHERGASGSTPQTLPYKLAPGISNWPLTTGSAGPPSRPDPREGSAHQAGPPGPCHTFDVG